MYEGSKDITGKRSIVHIADDDADAVESRDYQRGHTYLQNATTLLGDNEWWAGDSMTYADVAMFAALHGLDELHPGFLESHGNACCHLALQTYLQFTLRRRLMKRAVLHIGLLCRLYHAPRVCGADGGPPSHQRLLGQPASHPDDGERRSKGAMVERRIRACAVDQFWIDGID